MEKEKISVNDFLFVFRTKAKIKILRLLFDLISPVVALSFCFPVISLIKYSIKKSN